MPSRTFEHCSVCNVMMTLLVYAHGCVPSRVDVHRLIVDLIVRGSSVFFRRGIRLRRPPMHTRGSTSPMIAALICIYGPAIDGREYFNGRAWSDRFGDHPCDLSQQWMYATAYVGANVSRCLCVSQLDRRLHLIIVMITYADIYISLLSA